jgi:hypothetical protein
LFLGELRGLLELDVVDAWQRDPVADAENDQHRQREQNLVPQFRDTEDVDEGLHENSLMLQTSCAGILAGQMTRDLYGAGGGL